MPSTTSLASRLAKDFPEITFQQGDHFHWQPSQKVISYITNADTSSLLHETAHAVLGHSEYDTDIDLLKMERQAWEYTRNTLAPQYALTIEDDYIESMLDSYRDWLHSRSLCPSCEATGIQADTASYLCLACKTQWRVNEARTCNLRRYKQK